MENQNPNAPRKSARWKFVFGLLGIIFLTLAILAGGKFYFFWRGTRAVQELAEALKRAEEEDYQRAMADTYGGKTPQETLRMYIDAVEKGDYELASRYFIGEKQEGELESSRKMSEVEMKKYINVLKATVIKLDVNGKYDAEKKYFSLYEPILIREKIYPNGIWKIIEI